MLEKKLNLGCGYNKKLGYINVDSDVRCEPDVVLDLENATWPWETSSIDEVKMIHVLEHLGQTTSAYFHVIKELYRVCKPNALIEIHVPHPRHENFMHDPTHVRAITAEGLAMFSQKRNSEDMARGGAETKLGMMIGVDFEIQNITYVPDEHYYHLIQRNQISQEQLNLDLKQKNNVCQEIQLIWKVIKN